MWSKLNISGRNTIRYTQIRWNLQIIEESKKIWIFNETKKKLNFCEYCSDILNWFGQT